MLEKYTADIQLAYSNNYPDSSLDEQQVHLIRYLVACLVGSRLQVGNIYRFNMMSNAIRSSRKIKNNELKELIGKIDLREFTDEKAEMVRNALICAGFLKTNLIFECDAKSHYEEIEDPEDYDFFASELQKSLDAAKKFPKHTIEYDEIRGKVFHLYSGQEGLDPVDYIHYQDVWTKQVELDPKFVSINEEDMIRATEEILSAEIKEKIELRAREIAVERLK